MDIYHAIRTLIPDICTSRDENCAVKVALRSCGINESRAAALFLLTRLSTKQESKATLRLTLRRYFFLKMDRAFYYANLLVDTILPEFSDNEQSKTENIEDNNCSNNNALRLYTTGNYIAARRMWNQGSVYTNTDPFNAINYELCRWRLGEIQPIDILTHVESLAAKGVISDIVASEFIDSILIEGGHFPSHIPRPTQFMSTNIPFPSVSRLCAVTSDRCVSTLGNAFSVLQTDIDGTFSERLYYHNTSDVIQSSNEFLWYTRNTDDIDEDVIDRVGLHVLFSSQVNNQGAAVDRAATLFIHNELYCNRSVISVHRVISVDADCVHENLGEHANTSFTFTILFEGIVKYGENPIKVSSYGEADLEEEGYVTDSYDSREHHTESDSDEKDDLDLLPLLFSSFSLQNASYFLVIGWVNFNGKVRILRANKLTGLLKDQLPSAVKMTRDAELLVVGGSCGLVISMDKNGGCIVMNKESLHAHSFAACITVIEISPVALDIVATGDIHGTICVWRRQQDGTWNFLSLNLGARIVSLKLSQSGHIMCVGLRDRLLLVGTNDIAGSCNLYIRSVLDITKGYRSFYSCFFGEQDGYIRIWKAMEGHSCSTIFKHWTHPDVDTTKNDLRCRFFWTEAEHVVVADAVVNKLSDLKFVESVCLEASKHIVYNRFDEALDKIKKARETSMLLRYDKDLLAIFLRLASFVELLPGSTARLVDLEALLTLPDHPWLCDTILCKLPTQISHVCIPTNSSESLVEQLPTSVDRGEVFNINERLMLSASCWRTNAFSQFFNTVRIHNLMCENDEDGIELLLSFTPPLPSTSNGDDAKGRISALAFSDLGSYLLIASHAGTADSGEVGIWHITENVFVANLTVVGIVAAAEFRCSHTLLSLWFERNGALISDGGDTEPRFIFIDWQRVMTLKHSNDSREDIIKAFRNSNKRINNFQRSMISSGDINSFMSRDNWEKKLIDFELDVTNNDMQDIIGSLSHPTAIDMEHFFANMLTPLDFSADEDKRHLLIPDTRDWVFQDLQDWLHSTSNHSSDANSPSSAPGNKIWLLQSPAGYGKTVIAATIAENFKDFIAAKHFARQGNPPSLNELSFCLSISNQFCKTFGTLYQNRCLSNLRLVACRVVHRICKNNTEIISKWGQPFLDIGGSQIDHFELTASMIARTHTIHELLIAGICSDEEKLEISVLCELLSSFQAVIGDEGATYVIPFAHTLAINDLFEALISDPLISFPTQTSKLPKILLIDGLDMTFDSIGGNLILRLVRLISLRSPEWFRVVLTSRCHGDELSKEIDDLHPNVIHLYGENHCSDIRKICYHLLEVKEFDGNLEEGVEILLQKSDSCIHYIHFLQLYLQKRATRAKLLHMSINIDIHKFTLVRAFVSEASKSFQRAKAVLEVFCAAFEPPPVGLICAALDIDFAEGWSIVTTDLSEMLFPSGNSHVLVPYQSTLQFYLSDIDRIGQEFWIDPGQGHNALCALYLRFCSNKSIAVDHPWQQYLRTYGPTHLRKSNRGLRKYTSNIRKIDETSGIKGILPYQLGYVTGLQELYARRVGLCSKIPSEFGELSQLRVLSMGNNQLSGPLPKSLGGLTSLQRIVLHQNKLSGEVPSELGKLGCIVNLAGNPGLKHGAEVPAEEREALEEVFRSTDGSQWTNRARWMTSEPVSTWYKVGVLASHVHSIVMSSNNMVGKLPESIGKLTHLRMIELATMPLLSGIIPQSLCVLTTLRRLCICRCGLKGRIPDQIGNLTQLEELQLFGNQLIGKLPDSLSQLVSLRLLSLGEYTGGNAFDPAPLPECLSTLTSIEAIFMANCNICGPIPSWIGNLKELRQLDIQNNNLSGKLPRDLGLLTNLLYLNVKDNNGLSGELPIECLAKLTKLNRLSLVHCSFTNPHETVDVLQSRLPRCRIWI